MARGKLQRHGVERGVGKRQRMRIADLGADRQIAFAGAALTSLGHMRAAVHGMNLERRVRCQEPQRDVVQARTDIEHFRSGRHVPADRGREGIAPARAIPQRRDRIALVVIGRNVAKDLRNQSPPGIGEQAHAEIFLLQEFLRDGQ